ncbi:MAG TPA: tetratricopeptide repeat protein [Verrucomicrobiae bacterium]
MRLKHLPRNVWLPFLLLLVAVCFVVTAHACIWDGDTLADDIKKSPKLADAILNPRPPQVDRAKLTARLNELLGDRKENDPEWWNNVAGTYLRLGQEEEAVKLLEPVVSRFENNYGIHANLGTAYHLLGRYAEAEKHIARDLELNPDAHFGLEKYHLALLQYLTKSKDYQARHVYVDEFTAPLFDIPDINQPQPYALSYVRDTNQSPVQLTAALQVIKGNSRADQEAKARLLLKLAAWDDPPAYAPEPKPRYVSPAPYDVSKHSAAEAARGKFELAEDEKFQEGVIYMAMLNPDEPACMTMLGMAALKSGDLNLAQKAFEKAITMGSPMKDVLELKILKIQTHIQESKAVSTKIKWFILTVIGVLCIGLWILVVIVKKLKRKVNLKQTASAMMLVLFWQCASPVHACIWDGDTLEDDVRKNPTLADAILNPKPPQVDRTKLMARLSELSGDRKENDPEWWNNVAGTYLRLGQAAEAVKLLEPVVSRFENNYGIHANLGTAYHLLGRYAEAEKHIARDLELNPDAHFGLEKFHLALLQYLAKPKEYQSRHLYVDEFTEVVFDKYGVVRIRPMPLERSGMSGASAPIAELEAELQAMIKKGESGEKLVALLQQLAMTDELPAYAAKYDLAKDPKFQEGVIYMATLNPKEPACMAMLGMAALYNQDLNLAKKAFERAIAMGSPMEPVLKFKIEQIVEHLKEADGRSSPPDAISVLLAIGVMGLAGIIFLIAAIMLGRKLWRKAQLAGQ